jgi:hypothetical protein
MIVTYEYPKRLYYVSKYFLNFVYIKVFYVPSA